MTARETATYVLRRLWLWPLELWLRPMALHDRLDEAPTAESISGVLGAGLWGAVIGTLVWLQSGDPSAIWVLSLSLAVAVAVAVAIPVARVRDDSDSAFAATIAIAIAIAFAGASVSAVTSVGALAGVLAGAFAGAIAGALPGFGARFCSGVETDARAFARAFALAFLSAFAFVGVYLILLAAVGLAAGVWIGGSMLSAAATTAALLTALLWWTNTRSCSSERIRNIASIAGGLSTATWGLVLPIIGFAFLSRSEPNEMPVWGFAITLSIGVGLVGGMFLFQADAFRRFALSDRSFETSDQRCARLAQWVWLWLPWAFFLPLAAAAKWLGPAAAGLDGKLDTLSVYLLAAPVLLTGLPAWPLAAGVAAWQYRRRAVLEPPEVRAFLRRSLPFRWQSCALPFPGLAAWLIRLGREQGEQAALAAIQQVQFDTLQIGAGRRAARRLASETDTALGFCGAVAVGTNAATLAALMQTGPAARALGALSRRTEGEDKQPLLLDSGDAATKQVGERPGFLGRFLPTRTAPADPEDNASLSVLREAPLSARIDYALQQSAELPGSDTVSDFRALLLALQALASPTDVRQSSDAMPPEPGAVASDWLVDGWTLVRSMANSVDGLSAEYRALVSASARRRLLKNRAARQRALGWDDLSNYWRAIGAEIWDHRVALLRVNAFPTGEPARSVHVSLEAADGTAWVHSWAGLDLLGVARPPS